MLAWLELRFECLQNFRVRDVDGSIGVSEGVLTREACSGASDEMVLSFARGGNLRNCSPDVSEESSELFLGGAVDGHLPNHLSVVCILDDLVVGNDDDVLVEVGGHEDFSLEHLPMVSEEGPVVEPVRLCHRVDATEELPVECLCPRGQGVDNDRGDLRVFEDDGQLLAEVVPALFHVDLFAEHVGVGVNEEDVVSGVLRKLLEGGGVAIEVNDCDLTRSC